MSGMWYVRGIDIFFYASLAYFMRPANGLFDIRFFDAVKLAYSCTKTMISYLLTRTSLYPNGLVYLPVEQQQIKPF